ncbi:MAG: HAMP domain-containing protein [SAR324 cluster bacterium]|nr:HAMP domain-containing protein [SAR324 cluster bacterium]
MRFTLLYKLFSIFFMMSLLIVCTMISGMKWFGNRHFEEYVVRREMERVGELVKTYYDSQQGWGIFQQSPHLWHWVLRESREMVPGRVNPPLFPPPPPGNRWQLQRHMRFMQSGVTLYDTNHEIVIGPELVEPLMVPVEFNDAIIGWIGMNKREPLTHPLDVGFLKEQSETLYVFGSGILLMTLLASLFLSRHLLAPVRQLSHGTRELTQRNFKVRLSVTTTDELGQLAEDFNRMAETLNQYEQLRQQWISDIAHELRTPLSILQGEVEALQDGVRPVDSQTLSSLHGEVLHLNKLVHDLHELSLADSGELSMNKQRIDPVQLLQRVLTTFHPRLEKQGIQVHNELMPQSTVTVDADADRLIQVFSNLLENTLRYTDAPGILCLRQSVTPEKLMIIFEDSAPGVPDESIPRLFDRLYRVEVSRNRQNAGSGLGLAICKSIMVAHGGTIEAGHSDLNGLRIELSIPHTRKPLSEGS